MKSILSRSTGRLICLVLVGATTYASACTACFGQSDSEMAVGMNWGIFTLLGVVGMVLSCIVGAVVVIGRRSIHVNRSQSPIAES